MAGSVCPRLGPHVHVLELEKEKTEEKDLVQKVKNILVHETHMDEELIKLQADMTKLYYEDYKAIRKLQFDMLHNSRYQSRKNFRMLLLDEYMARMTLAIDIAFGGEAGMSASSELMAAIGIKGYTTVKFQHLDHDNDHFYSKMYFDTGSLTPIDRTVRNDSTMLLQTKTRLYLVSTQFLDGSSLSMAEVRVVKGITPDCSLMVHVNLNSYKVISPGNLTCFIHGQGKVVYSLVAGDMIHLEGRDHCKNLCVEIGFRGFVNKHKVLPPQPPSQPAVLQHYFYDMDPEVVPAPLRVLEKAHQVSHDVLSVEIRENEAMLQQIREREMDVDKVSQVGSYSGYVGAAVSIIIAIVLIGMCIKCRKQKLGAEHKPIQMQTFQGIREMDGEEENVAH
jgi:hypothetical protein